MMRLTTTKSGIVLIDNTPFYYIDKQEGDLGDLIVAYDFSKRSLKNYNNDPNKDPRLLAKAQTKETYALTKFKDSSNLAKYLGNKLGNDNTKTVERVVYKAPLFVSRVEEGIDSVTNQLTLGFKEMKTMSVPVNAQQANQVQEPIETGVFIGLNNVYWLEETIDYSNWKDYLNLLYDSYMPYFNLIK